MDKKTVLEWAHKLDVEIETMMTYIREHPNGLVTRSDLLSIYAALSALLALSGSILELDCSEET